MKDNVNLQIIIEFQKKMISVCFMSVWSDYSVTGQKIKDL